MRLAACVPVHVLLAGEGGGLRGCVCVRARVRAYVREEVVAWLVPQEAKC